MKTGWKTAALDKTVTGWETFHRIKLCIFSSLLIDQFPQDISMPNQSLLRLFTPGFKRGA